MYDAASKSVMFILVSHEIMGSIVAFLRIGSHVVSFGDSESAFLMVGLFAGQVTTAGAYPPEGELGRARAIALTAHVSAVGSLGKEIAFALHRDKDASDANIGARTFMVITYGYQTSLVKGNTNRYRSEDKRRPEEGQRYVFEQYEVGFVLCFSYDARVIW